MKRNDLWNNVTTLIVESYRNTFGHLPEEEKIPAICDVLKNSNYSVTEDNIDLKDEKSFFIQVMDHFNSRKGGRGFDTVYPSPTSKQISVLRKMGYTLQDFYKVIDKKCDEWLGTNMQKYIRPKTFFAKDNFMNYISELDDNGTTTKPGSQTGFERLIGSGATAAAKATGINAGG